MKCYKKGFVSSFQETLEAAFDGRQGNSKGFGTLALNEESPLTLSEGGNKQKDAK